MFGYTPGELQGVNVSVLVPKPFSDYHNDLVQKHAQHFGEIYSELTNMRPVLALHKKGHTLRGNISITEVHGNMEEEDTYAVIFEPVDVRPPLIMSWLTHICNPNK